MQCINFQVLERGKYERKSTKYPSAHSTMSNRNQTQWSPHSKCVSLPEPQKITPKTAICFTSWSLNYILLPFWLWVKEEAARGKELVDIIGENMLMDCSCSMSYGQLDISAALPVWWVRLDARSLLLRETHVIEFPTANLICTEMKLYGICLAKSINCFLCFPSSHKYSSFAAHSFNEDERTEQSPCQLVILQLTPLVSH